jgi:hypothetical protein
LSLSAHSSSPMFDQSVLMPGNRRSRTGAATAYSAA